VGIEHRPKIVEEKSRFGDFEIDLIVGAGQSGYIISMVDRMTKYVKLTCVSSKDSLTVAKAIINTLKFLGPYLKTVTADNGKEFSEHEFIAKKLMVDMFFADPYCSWQRGLNEHTNGLVRQYLPKGTSFANLSQYELDKIEKDLNTRPRKILNFSTPEECLSKLSII
jgi:IS30 family transposase